jgi:F0F1-type ATP synthase membrane subunit b/b'
MTPNEHIETVQAIDLGAFADQVLAGDQVLSAGMVDIDMSIFFMLGLFIVFAVLMHYLVLKPLIASQEARYKGMGGAREDASSYELRAAEMRLDYERRIHKARQDAVQIRDAIKKDATATAQERTAATQQATDAQIEAAKGELAKFGDRARLDMKAHAEALATELSTKMIGGKA